MTDHQDETTSRRRVLLGTGAIAGLAGCLGFGDDGDGSTPGSASQTEAATATRSGTTTDATSTESTSSTDSETTDDEEGPGYKQDHWHGRLFFEVDGDFVDFDQSTYYLDSIEDERPETVYFHFHGTEAHGPNEWSNEKQIVTFERALNLLPGIGYDTAGGKHVISYDGTTYDASTSGTSISIHRGTERIDPTSYEVQHDDNFWVSVRTDGGGSATGSGGTTTATSTGTSSSGDARSGKLFVDVNNRRLEYEAGATDGNASGFEFRDDGQPSTWYDTGDATTLADALEALPDVAYEQSSGGKHVVTYDADDALGGTYRETASETQVIVRQRTTPVDPASYKLQDGDAVWVYVHTSNAPDNEH